MRAKSSTACSPSPGWAMQRPEGDPSALLERVFGRIARERFAGVEILNPALQARAVGFERGAHGWAGVMVAPWLMNLMVLPASGMPWRGLAVGERGIVDFPAGRFEMLGGEEEEIGPYLYCPMVSTMSSFSSQADAEAVAAQVCALLKDAATAQEVRRMNPAGTLWLATAAAAGAAGDETVGDGEGAQDGAEPMDTSRREFMRGGPGSRGWIRPGS
jgi:[NiFe] hydrogenase assembly HybE family chaperone